MVRKVPRLERNTMTEEDYNPIPWNQYEDSYASQKFEDDRALAVGCGVVAVIVMALTTLGIIVSWL